MLKWRSRTTLDIVAASIAGNGDLLTCLTGPSIDAIELLDAEGNTLWKRYSPDLFGAHHSEDGDIIVIDRYHIGERALEAYGGEGTILWRYTSSDLGTVKALSMEKDGSFIALYAVRYTDKGEVNKLITLRRDGRIVQDTAVRSKEVVPEKLYAAGRNVILLGLSRDQHSETLVIRKGEVLAKWEKPVLSVSMTYSGDRIAICDYEEIHVYNGFGELLWGHPGAGGAKCWEKNK